MTDTNVAANTRHPDVIAQHERLNELRDGIFGLGLERNVVELELYGDTIIPHVQPATFFAKLIGRNNPYPSVANGYGLDREKVAMHITKTKDVRG